MAAEVLYVTLDGVLQPLVFAQAIRVVAGLAGRGVRYHLLSVERPADLAKPELIHAVDEMLRPVGVKWTRLPAASMGTARLAAQVVARVAAEAAAIVRRERIKLVHARGYQSALIALAMKRLLGVPYVFDARGYWIEERCASGEWFSTAPAYAMGKFVEQALFRGAKGVVTLTKLQAIDLASGQFGPPPRLLEVIPTCADYDVFYLGGSRPGKPADDETIPKVVRERLHGKLVMGIVGALNNHYLVTEALSLAKRVMQTSPVAHVLVLSAKQREYEMALQSAGISRERYTITSAEHEAMPQWLQWIDWGLLLLSEAVAKRASMPTKLAEFFATGVRPMLFGCNSEVAHWVERAGSGYVMRSTQVEDIKSAAVAIVNSTAERSQLQAARDVTEPYFGLASGLDRYRGFLAKCLDLREE